LRGATGLDLRLATVRNFHRYWLEARRDSAAPLIIEDSHMAAWRMNNHGYTPLVTTERPVTFSLLASNASMEPTLDEFIGKRVSTLPSPSLGYLILTDWYDNPLQQPVVLSNATSWLDAVEIVFSMEADAAVVPRAIAERVPQPDHHRDLGRAARRDSVGCSGRLPKRSSSADRCHDRPARRFGTSRGAF
jgi:hypothetical protein